MHQPDPSLNNNNNNIVEPQFLVASSMIPEDLSLNNNNNNFVEPQFLVASSMIPEDLCRHSFSGGSPLLMNIVVIPAGTRDESGQDVLTGGQVMEVLWRDALLPRFGPQLDVWYGSSRGSSPHQAGVLLIPGWDRQPSGGVSLQAAREMELVPYDFGPQSHVLDHSLAVAGIPEHLELALIPAREIEDDVGSQTDAFNDLPHQEEPPVERVIDVEQSRGYSAEAPASMRNHAMVKKLTEELPKIMISLCGATNIALVRLKVNGYSNDNSIIPLEFVGIVNAVAFAGFMAGFSLDKIAPKIANFSTQSGIALTTVSVFSLSSWIFSVKAIVVPAFFGVLALGTWGISRSIRGLGGAAA